MYEGENRLQIQSMELFMWYDQWYNKLFQDNNTRNFIFKKYWSWHDIIFTLTNGIYEGLTAIELELENVMIKTYAIMWWKEDDITFSHC